MDWDQLVQAEPRLQGIENYLRGWRKGCRRNGRINLPTKAWKKRGDIEARLSSLVGRSASNPKLRSWLDYDTAFKHLDKVLHYSLREEVYFENGKYVAVSMRHHIMCRGCDESIAECACGRY